MHKKQNNILKKFNTFIGTVLILITNTCLADWEFVYKNENGYQYYVNNHTRQIVGNSIFVLEFTNFLEPTDNNEMSILVKTEYDCLLKRWRGISARTYEHINLKGKLIENYELDSNRWEISEEGTAALAINEKVCSFIS